MKSFISIQVRKRLYGNHCSAIDVLTLSKSVRTFDNRIWENCENGRFVCFSLSESISLASLYPYIHTVENGSEVIARKSKLKHQLRFLKKLTRVQ